MPLKPIPAMTSEEQVSLLSNINCSNNKDGRPVLHMRGDRLRDNSMHSFGSPQMHVPDPPFTHVDEETGPVNGDLSAPTQVPAGSAVTGPSGDTSTVPGGGVGVGPPSFSSSRPMTSEEQMSDTSGNPNPAFVDWTPNEVAALTQLCDDQKGVHDWPQISLQLAHLNEEEDLNPLLRQLREARSPDETRRKMEGIPKGLIAWTQAETATVLWLVQEQEGGRNWAEIEAKLKQANEEGALNPELHQGGRTRSADDVRHKVPSLLKQQQAGAFAYTPSIGCKRDIPHTNVPE